MPETWSSGWQERVRDVVRSLGYEDVFAFVMSRPGRCFGEVCEQMRQAMAGTASAIAIVQLIEVFYDDAERQGCLREAFMDALVRSLRQYVKGGWNRGRNVLARRLDAHAEWPMPSRRYDEWCRMKDRVWQTLELLEPPDDWCPADHRDALIQKSFTEVWPADSKE